MKHNQPRLDSDSFEASFGTSILKTATKSLQLPVYFPDATYGFVKSMDSERLVQCGVQGLVMNIFHLMRKPGISVIKQIGGLHRFSSWDGPIITDSGGFQVYSMIRQNSKMGSISNQGIVFHPDGTSKNKIKITPEKSIQHQYQTGADILFCLDDCTHVSDAPEINQASVKRTVQWARACKATFNSLLEQQPRTPRPLLFAVIQGGDDVALRKQCAEELLEIGFDGFGFGGYPMDEQGNLLEALLDYTHQLIPAEFPLFGLGIGHPYHIFSSMQHGFRMFDCALPTRDARRGRLIHIDFDTLACQPFDKQWFSYVYIRDDKYIKEEKPIAADCLCDCCQQYSLAFLHHLSKMDDPLLYHLATVHNLSIMSRFMKVVGEY